MSVKESAAASAAGEEDALLEAEEVETADGDETEGEEAEEEGEEAEESDGEEAADEGAEKPEADKDDGKPSKSKLKREKQKARTAVLEEIARHESDRADKAEAALRAARGDIGPEPKESDYPDERSYAAALNAYEADKRITARTLKTSETAAKDAKDSAAIAKLNLFHERAMALAARYPDIEAKVFNDPTAPISQVAADILMDSERGPEVAYYLATHREEAGRIGKMQPLALARELGRIEASLDTAPKPRTQSNAPAPPKIVKGGKSSVAKDPEKMNEDEWLVWRNAQLARKRG